MAEAAQSDPSGAFTFDTERRTVWVRGVQLPLGKRPFALLSVLASQSGQIVTQRELIEKVWPGEGVNLGSLRVHMSALARSLEQATGAQLINNDHGRGYWLLPEIPPDGGARADPAPDLPPFSAFPARPQKLIGLDEAVEAVAVALASHRLVSIVGPGGVGKTSLAIAAAQRQRGDFAEGAAFVDLSLLDRPEALAHFVWQAAGLHEAQGVTLQDLADALASRSVLLVLDNCEHLIDATAELCEAVIPAAPGVRLLATSREALRAVTEKVIRLPGMAFPRAEVTDPAAALDYPAVQLFAEQASASGSDLVLGAPEVNTIARICAGLDGLPLAIKYAAGLLGILSLDEIAAGIDRYLFDLGSGPRAAAPRHQTLMATLDWSFRLLSSDERLLLIWLATFQGEFLLDAAVTLAQGAGLARERVPSLLADLVAKSLVSVRHTGSASVYRLLETMRHYAWHRLTEAGGEAEARRHHARLMIDLLREANQIRSTTRRPDWIARYGALVADIRFAVAWALTGGADHQLGARLLIGAIPLRLPYWTTSEYLSRLRSALAIVDTAPWAKVTDRVVLSYEIGHILNLTRGETDELERMAATAEPGEGRDDPQIPERFMSRWVAGFTHGLYDATLEPAHGLAALADETGDRELAVVAERIMAQSLHFMGDQEAAEALAEKVLATRFEQLPYSQIPHAVSMRIVLSRIAFLRGRADEATRIAAQALDLSERTNAMSLCQALGLAAVPVAIWRDDLQGAGGLAETLRRVASEGRMDYWMRWAEDQSRAIDWLAAGKPARRLWLEEKGISPKVIDFLATVAPDLCTEKAIARVDMGSVGWNAPEVLRAAALRLWVADPPRADDLLRRGLQLAEKQGAQAWAARIAASLQDMGRAGPASRDGHPPSRP
ncbi:hypothetical protein GC209_13400 [bacterium]|nr:hypothetical protein [bacterium]